MALTLYNTLTNIKEPFTTRTSGAVKMFVCGPTVYDFSHVGHAKTYTQFDLVARYLRHSGYRVTYAQNITDVDDKIIRRAREIEADPQELATTYEQHYREDMAALGNTSVDVFARAHDHIDAIVEQVRQLIDRGHAYQLDDGWYFDLASFPEYGKLSGRTDVQPEDSLSRIDEHTGKKNPGDFALWKARKPGEPYWGGVLGEGRPGWHIEDTAITNALFGPQYDLHGGAVDLIFPHHEAEIAQMESASGLAPLARYWMHTGLLRVNGSKMSKSLGNFTTIREALAHTDYRTLRYVFLSQHYRSSTDYTADALAQSLAARRRVENFARTIATTETMESSGRAADARKKFFARLDDDFDAPGALAVLFDYIRETNRGTTAAGPTAGRFLDEVNSLFDTFEIASHQDTDDSIDIALRRREEHRKNKEFSAADAIRDELAAQGITIEDTPEGTRWWRT
ncbi:cysteine--tRNA ligase [Streptomyces sp. ST2-7A]|uniref:cysteine--tRNA ligase n=1 Tax=Streptomyces sp. ST2-7A TaxID=2907214 RepID=UPI001F020280|nr:cysteine--tRNA ligase [Streptomyces sp. ST2-7A]MCE7080459.1 cysteine--tRNA ligase [Streptomyces sp. ST2-7A]